MVQCSRRSGWTPGLAAWNSDSRELCRRVVQPQGQEEAPGRGADGVEEQERPRGSGAAPWVWTEQGESGDACALLPPCR